MCVCVSHSVMSNSLWPHGLTVHRILKAIILEWVAISFSRAFSPPRDGTWVSYIAGRIYHLSHQGNQFHFILGLKMEKMEIFFNEKSAHIPVFTPLSIKYFFCLWLLLRFSVSSWILKVNMIWFGVITCICVHTFAWGLWGWFNAAKFYSNYWNNDLMPPFLWGT